MGEGPVIIINPSGEARESAFPVKRCNGYKYILPGLALIDALASSGDLDGCHLLHAARADLLRRLGSQVEAAKSYTRALTLATNDSERRFLRRRLNEVQRLQRPA